MYPSSHIQEALLCLQWQNFFSWLHLSEPDFQVSAKCKYISSILIILHKHTYAHTHTQSELFRLLDKLNNLKKSFPSAVKNPGLAVWTGQHADRRLHHCKWYLVLLVWSVHKYEFMKFPWISWIGGGVSIMFVGHWKVVMVILSCWIAARLYSYTVMHLLPLYITC